MGEVACGICRDPIATLVDWRGDLALFRCRRCGEFWMTGTAADLWKRRSLNERQIAVASGWVREQRGVQLDSSDCDWLASAPSPGVAERAERLLNEIERRTVRTGGRVEIGKEPEWVAISWSISVAEVEYLLFDYLVAERGYAEVRSHLGETGHLPVRVGITPKGYAYLEDRRRAGQDSSIGFCAMWFDPSISRVWSDAIGPAIRDAGYEPRRLDEYEHNNRIDDEIIATIRRSRFVVADLTGQRGGAYFEAGFALGIGLPVVWTVREQDAEHVHFDNRQYNFIRWDLSDLGSFRSRLQNRIEATLGRGLLRV